MPRISVTQISQAMSELDTATQQNAIASSEMASSAGEMMLQATELQNLVIILNKVVLGTETVQIENKEEGHQDIGKKTGSRHSRRPQAGSQTLNHQNNSSKLKLLINNSGGESKSKKASSQTIIPFDDNSSPGKVGTTDGF